MFMKEQDQITDRIKGILKREGLFVPESIPWKAIPFSGTWGIGTSVSFQVAAKEAKDNPGSKVGQRAGEIAQLVVEDLEQLPGIAAVKAEKGFSPYPGSQV